MTYTEKSVNDLAKAIKHVIKTGVEHTSVIHKNVYIYYRDKDFVAISTKDLSFYYLADRHCIKDATNGRIFLLAYDGIQFPQQGTVIIALLPETFDEYGYLLWSLFTAVKEKGIKA